MQGIVKTLDFTFYTEMGAMGGFQSMRRYDLGLIQPLGLLWTIDLSGSMGRGRETNKPLRREVMEV